MPPKKQTQANTGRPELSTQIRNRENSLYVGNIPFDADPYELLALLDKIGKVSAFKAPTDPETNKLRGFVFVEFAEHKHVETAIKNFNNYQFLGRPLKVDSASKQENEPRVVGPSANSPAATGSGAAGGLHDEVWGAICDPAEAPTEIARIVSQLSPEMVRTVVYDIRRMLLMHPHESQQALARYPQMSYALLLCLVRTGQLTETEAKTMLYNTQPATPVMPLPGAPAAPIVPGGSAAVSYVQGTTPTYGSSSNSPWQGGGGNNSPWAGGNVLPKPPVGGPPYGRSPRFDPPVSSRSPAMGPSSSGSGNADRQKLIALVSMASEAEIQRLPADVREQILQLRQQLGKSTPNA